MEVKEIQKPPVDQNSINQAKKASPKQRAVSALSARSVDVSRADSVSIKVEASARGESNVRSRERANSLINVLNFAAEATKGIDDLVRSVSGIVEQVDKAETPSIRTEVLQREANQLVDEIRKQANAAGPNGVKLLAGDSVRVDLEEKLGKTLEVLLPEDASNAFGLGTIEFSTKDAVIATRASVEEARLRLEALKSAVAGVRDQVTRSVSELDVALQNDEAARVNIRDVEGALEVTNSLRSGIKTSPNAALGSLGALNNVESFLK